MIWVGCPRQEALIGVPRRSSAVQKWLCVGGRRLYKRANWRSLKCRRTLNLLWAPAFQYFITPPFLPRRVRREQKMSNKPNSPKPAGRPGRRRRKCAKRTQFPPVGENRWGKPHPANAPNEPNFVRPGLPRKRKCAKRTQFLDCGFRIANCGLRTDMRWDACPAVRHVGVAEGEMYETNPIWEEFQVSSFKWEAGEPSGESSDFTLYTSNFRRAAGGTCCTNKANCLEPREVAST